MDKTIPALCLSDDQAYRRSLAKWRWLQPRRILSGALRRKIRAAAIAGWSPRRRPNALSKEELFGADPAGFVVIGAGGGIPVVRSPQGDYQSVDAVIDKDLSTALLARRN